MSLRYPSLADVPAHLLGGQVDRRATAAPGSQKPRKYRNTPTVVDGIRFDSKLEARCYQWLFLQWKAGEVLWFVRQVNFDLPGGIKYRADFVVVGRQGVLVVDAKGIVTPDCRNKVKLMKATYDIEVVLWTDVR